MKRAAALALLLLLSGCGNGKKEALLQTRVDELTAERSRYVELAQTLLPLRRETEKLEQDLAAAQESSLNPEYFHDGVADAGKGAQVTWDGADRATFSGRGGTAQALAVLDRASTRIPAGGLAHLSIGANGAWKADVFRILSVPAAAASPTSTPFVTATPAPGVVESARVARLRSQITSLERENAELRRLVGETSALAEKRARLAAEAQSLERADRMVNAEPVLSVLLGQSSAGLVSGELAFDADRVRVKGVLAKGAPDDVLVAVLEKHFAVTRHDATLPALDLELSRLSTN